MFNTMQGLVVMQSAPVRDMLSAGDKTYTVLAVVLIIWIGLATVLIILNRRVGKLEQRVKSMAADQKTT